jgi:hypothetical protein
VNWAGGRRSEVYLVAAASSEVANRVIRDPTARINRVDGTCQGDSEAGFDQVAEIGLGQPCTVLRL